MMCILIRILMYVSGSNDSGEAHLFRYLGACQIFVQGYPLISTNIALKDPLHELLHFM